jgi:hypothetical protein
MIFHEKNGMPPREHQVAKKTTQVYFAFDSPFISSHFPSLELPRLVLRLGVVKAFYETRRVSICFSYFKFIHSKHIGKIC